MKSASKPVPGPSKAIATRFESGVVVAKEARLHPRRRAEFTAHVATLEAARDRETGAPFFLITEGRTLDVGDGGLGLEVQDAIAEGVRVLVDVELDGGRTLACHARVVWTSTDVAGAQFVGVCFDEPKPGLALSL